jgi:hypothetical protein
MTLKFQRVALLALPLAVAAIAAPGASATVPQFPTVAEIAAHEGGTAPNVQPAAPRYPTARQIAVHQGGLPESSPATAAASTGGKDNTTAIVLIGAALAIGFGGFGFVAGRRSRAHAVRVGGVDSPLSSR